MSHRPPVLACALALAIAAAAAAQSGSTAAIIGLIGQATHATQELDLRVTEAQGAGNRTFAELEPALDQLLDRHLQIASTLRSAYALMNTAPGYDPTARVAGLPDSQVRELDPEGFYYSAARAHQGLNDRLGGLLDLYADELPPEAAVYREKLQDALRMAAMPRR